MTTSNFYIKTSVSELHSNWNIFANDTIFLQKSFLLALEQSTPSNMRNYYVEFFSDSNLIGIALFQHIDLKSITPFQVKEINLKSRISSWALNSFASSILFIGNNLMSGQNAFRFSSKVALKIKYQLLADSADALRKQLKSYGKKVHITVWKDFEKLETIQTEKHISTKFYKFAIQPTMVFTLPPSIESESDYINLLSKKYKDQYKRARKKAGEIEKRQLTVSEIQHYEMRLYELYLTTVANASFNTFYLPKNHFRTMKNILGDSFQVYAYFLNTKLIGFNTIIKNSNTLEPYFLGYDAEQQKSRLLYLNMLYDIIGYASAKNFQKIAFGRTALEIKSSVGAKPVELFGFIKHSNPVLNIFIAKIFMSLEPKVEWKVRNPFKLDELGQQA